MQAWESVVPKCDDSLISQVFNNCTFANKKLKVYETQWQDQD